MLAETINGIEITVNEALVLQAIEEFLNRHMFKEAIKIVRLHSREHIIDPANNMIPIYKITCESTLARLAGEETVH
jgi:hypothetical protein